MKSIYLSLTFAFLLATGLTIGGCTKTPKILIINNSGRSLTLIADKQVEDLRPGGSIEITFPWSNKCRLTNSANINWQYSVFYPPETWMHGQTFFIQVESDGRIFLVPPLTTSVVRTLPIQPAGFPWVPDRPKAERRVRMVPLLYLSFL
jgi:hypothetical protein